MILLDLLIDTHIFIWWQESPEKLSETISEAIFNESNRIYLSLVSIWEMQIKIQSGKLKVGFDLRTAIDIVQESNDLQILPIRAEHIYEMGNLPFHHKDPFDRLLISQAIIENLTIVSDDAIFPAYSVNVL